MSYRKTWVSYVLWAVYTGVCIMLLAFMGHYMNVRYFFDGEERQGLSVLCVLMVFPVILALYFGIRASADAVRKQYTVQPHTAAMWEWFAAALIFALGLLYQIREFLYLTVRIDAGEELALCGSEFYQNARITVTQGSSVSNTGAGWLYERLLSLFLSFLGNKISSALVLQLLLQAVIMGLCYAVVRKLAGRLPACITLFCVAYVMGSGILEERLDPGKLIFTLYLAGLLFLADYTRAALYRKKGKALMAAAGLLLGGYLGVLLFLDLTAATLLLFLIAFFAMAERKQEEDTAGKRMFAVLLPLASGIVVWLAVYSVCDRQSGETFAEGLQRMIGNGRWIQPFAFEGWKEERALLFFWLLLGSAAFLTIEFLRRKQANNFSAWMLAGLAAALTPFAGNGQSPCELTAIFIWGVFAGLGIQNVTAGEPREVRDAMLAEINEAVDEKPMPEHGDPEQSPKEETEQNAEVPESPKPRFIENPLPLPKKHIHKEMDYQYPVEDAAMKYDVEVDEQDDFDLKD